MVLGVLDRAGDRDLVVLGLGMSRRPRTLKEWNLFRMASGYVIPCRNAEVLYWFYEKYPDLCVVCSGEGLIDAGIVTPFGIIVERGTLCPACRGAGSEPWYSTN